MYKYILLYRTNDHTDYFECEYVSLRYSLRILKKYKVYIFRFKQDEDILYINYPFSVYYSSSKINEIENNNEERVQSFGHIEIRLHHQYPTAKICVNMENF